MYALADCNNFFVSCERLFRPDLEGKPVIVLSNNDGCAVARSNEAKALGIAMGAPYFKKMTVHLPKGRLVINAPDNSDENRYVEQLKVNGKNYDRNYVKHEDLVKGMTMNYVMGNQPNTKRGTKPEAAPYSFSKELLGSKK